MHRTGSRRPPTDGADRIPIGLIRPTQGAVGLREVAAKRARFRKASLEPGGDARFRDRAFPVIVGPGGDLYAIDGHHWLMALAEEGVTGVRVCVIADLRALTAAEFWSELAARHWCHPYDGAGRRIAFDSMPTAMAQLDDDPFRSLAAALKRDGVLADSPRLFGDFACARFLRAIVPEAVARDPGGQPTATRLVVQTGKCPRRCSDRGCVRLVSVSQAACLSTASPDDRGASIRAPEAPPAKTRRRLPSQFINGGCGSWND